MSTTNDITRLAAQKDATFGFSGAVEVSAVGGSPKAASAAMALLTGISNNSLVAAQVAAGGLVAGALAGAVDATSAGIAAMTTVAGGLLGGKGKGWSMF